ncbi:MAG: hypothetical protein II852_00800 [Bacteroidales bacterium]|nr:hypothetical protein [Bacteroidales bacterium]
MENFREHGYRTTAAPTVPWRGLLCCIVFLGNFHDLISSMTHHQKDYAFFVSVLE